LPSCAGRPAHWWSLAPPFHPYRSEDRRSVLCGTDPAGCPGWLLATTLPCGARTFLGDVPREVRRRGRPARFCSRAPRGTRSATIHLRVPLPTPSSDLPAYSGEPPSAYARPVPVGTRLLDLAPGGVCLADPVARVAGGLLHHRFTLTAPARRHEWRSVFCGTFPRVTPGGCCPPPCPVEPGPSSVAPKAPTRSPGQVLYAEAWRPSIYECRCRHPPAIYPRTRAGRPRTCAHPVQARDFLIFLQVGFTDPAESPRPLVVSYTTVSP